MKRKESNNYDTLIRMILLFLMLVTVCFIIQGGRKLASSVFSESVETTKERPCVIIDAGHGGSK